MTDKIENKKQIPKEKVINTEDEEIFKKIELAKSESKKQRELEKKKREEEEEKLKLAEKIKASKRKQENEERKRADEKKRAQDAERIAQENEEKRIQQEKAEQRKIEEEERLRKKLEKKEEKERQKQLFLQKRQENDLKKKEKEREKQAQKEKMEINSEPRTIETARIIARKNVPSLEDIIADQMVANNRVYPPENTKIENPVKDEEKPKIEEEVNVVEKPIREKRVPEPVKIPEKPVEIEKPAIIEKAKEEIIEKPSIEDIFNTVPPPVLEKEAPKANDVSKRLDVKDLIKSAKQIVTMVNTGKSPSVSVKKDIVPEEPEKAMQSNNIDNRTNNKNIIIHSKDFTHVHCFECTSNTVWPGQPLQDGNNGFKTYTILSENASIVLNNNGTEKTEDIKITKPGNYWYTNGVLSEAEPII